MKCPPLPMSIVNWFAPEMSPLSSMVNVTEDAVADLHAEQALGHRGAACRPRPDRLEQHLRGLRGIRRVRLEAGQTVLRT